MTFRLLPKDEQFFTLFSANAEILAEATRKLEEMIASYDRLDERVAEIQTLEKRGDEINEEVNRRLDKAFITPFDRSDIHELITRMDDVLDTIQEIAEMFVIYGIEGTTLEARQLAGILTAQASQLGEALAKLEGLKGLEPHLAELHELENKADGLSRAAIARLFRDSGDPLEVIKWRDVYHELEEAIDAMEDTGEVLERMVHKGT
jgi:predicted phosphate transport protein (TIGR00153 family)